MTEPAEYITGRTVQEQMNQLISYVDARAAEVAVAAIADDMATLSQAVTDAESAKDDAEAARDAAISTLSDCVKKTPASAQTITGQDLIVSGADVEAVDLRASGNLSVGGTGAFTGAVTVPTEAQGTFSTKAANSQKVKDELDAYSAMLRTTGNQNLSGDKINVYSAATSGAAVAPAGFQQKVDNVTVNSTSSNRYFYLTSVLDSNGVLVGGIFLRYNANGNVHFILGTTDGDGNLTGKELTVFNRSTGVWS